MNLEDYKKYLIQKNSSPVAPRNPGQPIGGPQGLGHDMGNQLNELLKRKMMEAAYKNGGPTRPMEQTNQTAPSGMGAAHKVKPVTAPAPQPTMMKDQSRLAPNMMNDRGPKPQPEAKPDYWKTFRQQLSQQLLTPGYHDKQRGVWISPYQAAMEKRASKKQSEETYSEAKAMLKESGFTETQSDYISKQDPALVRSYLADMVKRPKNLGLTSANGNPLVKVGTDLYEQTPEGAVKYEPKAGEKVRLAEAEKRASLENDVENTKHAVDTINDYIKNAQTGLLGPGTMGGRIAATVDARAPLGKIRSAMLPLQASESLDELQRLRESSPNGSSGLGQVTEAEHKLLANRRRKLDPDDTDAETLMENVLWVHDYKSWLLNRQSDSQYGPGSGPSFEEWRQQNGYKPSQANGLSDKAKRYLENY